MQTLIDEATVDPWSVLNKPLYAIEISHPPANEHDVVAALVNVEIAFVTDAADVTYAQWATDPSALANESSGFWVLPMGIP